MISSIRSNSGSDIRSLSSVAEEGTGGTGGIGGTSGSGGAGGVKKKKKAGSAKKSGKAGKASKAGKARRKKSLNPADRSRISSEARQKPNKDIPTGMLEGLNRSFGSADRNVQNSRGEAASNRPAGAADGNTQRPAGEAAPNRPPAPVTPPETQSAGPVPIHNGLPGYAPGA
ncbi:MAG: hypothetical protein KF760_19040 [Candidatus Eremiobacteraeota bacterium]|nr:hypothetical protein [Candidatus Eremiobacteraeota bacterium]MCW5870285.1 hypothetical protein [Candidatus Eremiobacteraeota bacterium]